MALQGPPLFGVTGMPPGQHASSFPDLDSNRLVGGIETEGARLAWSRAADCPCVGINDQTEQSDPNCELCHGHGVIYFGPSDYVVPAAVGDLNEVQQAIVDIDGAAIIRGVIARITSRADVYDKLGRWMWGALSVSVRPENKLGYYDRLVSLDSEICYFETLDADGTDTLNLRYLATGVNMLRSIDTVYEQGVHFDVVVGKVKWLDTPPTTDTRLSAHYLTHPTWRVIEHPHIIRETARRRIGAAQTSPLGTPTPLPLQARVELEFLPVPGTP